MNNKRGSILVVTLGYILVFTLLGLSAMHLAMTQNEAAEKKIASAKAFWLAEAGLQKAVWDYEQNSCHGFYQEGTTSAVCGSSPVPCVDTTKPCTSDCSTCCPTCSNGNKRISAAVGSYGTYDITLDFLNSGVKSAGTVAAPSVTRTVSLNTDSLFKNALFAKGLVTVNNNLQVDSYNSSNGAYGVGNQFNYGGVATNSTSAGGIWLKNNVLVQGNLSTGPGGSPQCGNGATDSCSSYYTGTLTSTNTLTIPDVAVPSSLTSLGSEGNLSISGTQTLSGNHKYTAISMSNNSTLDISGDVSIYLTAGTSFSTGNNVTFNIPVGSKLTVYTDGTFLFGNGATINNISQIAKNFRVNSTYSGAGTGVNLSNNATTSATVYAPNANVVITNNGDFYGAVIGKTITLSGSSISKVHFDQALAEGGSLNTMKWSEL